jgi:hypothetical protein
MPDHADGVSVQGKAGSGWQCVDCGMVWARDAILGQHYHVSSDDDQIRCVLRTYCRQRQLRREMNLAGPDGGRVYYGQIPTPRMLHLADPRPKDWQVRRWKPLGTCMQRLDAFLMLHTVCFPVCRLYACKLNADGSDVDYEQVNIRGRITTTRKPSMLTVQQIANELNWKQENVSRTLKDLVARHLYARDEDGAIVFVPDPAPVTIEERWALTDEEVPEEGPHIPSDLRELPSEYRQRAYAVLTQAPTPDIKSDIRKRLLDPIRRYQEEAAPLQQQLADIRSTRNQRLEEAIIDCTNLLPRENRLESSSSPEPSSPVPETTTTPSHEAEQPRTQTAASGASRDTLEPAYEAGLGKAALAKLPPPEQRPALIALSEAIQPYAGVPDEPYLRQLIRECREQAPDCTVDEIVDAIHERGHRVKNRDHPMGYLKAAVVNCFRGDGLQRRREAARPPTRAQYTQEQRNEAETILQNPNSSDFDRHWARHVLGFPEEETS